MNGNRDMEKNEDTIVGTASVELIRENPDGSADYMFNFPPEVLTALTRLGIMTAIQAGIEEAKHLNPDVDANDMTQERVDFPDELRHIAEQAGFTFWSDEEWKPEGAIIDWSAADDSDLVNFYHLIVRECADIAYEVGLHRQTKHEILRRFGLEVTDEN